MAPNARPQLQQQVHDGSSQNVEGEIVMTCGFPITKLAASHIDTPASTTTAKSRTGIAYWDPANYMSTDADLYWAESVCSVSPLDHHCYCRGVNYWNEACYQPSATDAYWYDDRSASKSSTYWQEEYHKVTETDRYWSMSAV